MQFMPCQTKLASATDPLMNIYEGQLRDHTTNLLMNIHEGQVRAANKEQLKEVGGDHKINSSWQLTHEYS